MLRAAVQSADCAFNERGASVALKAPDRAAAWVLADGTELGLSIARQIAAAHGGSLRITSVPDEGTRVEVRLPAAPGNRA